MVARKAALAGLSGLEWASTIPGTVGGAVYGNAGAHGGDISGSLVLAEILQHESNSNFWPGVEMQFSYRSSILKKTPGKAVILSARFSGQQEDPLLINQRMDLFKKQRRNTQPPGASMGSMFKNPTGDYAGRMIEAAGLKGTRVGGVTVSPVHANFFVNNEQATANDIWKLIQLVRTKVYQQFNVSLELEIETIGFSTQTSNKHSTEWEGSLT
jgi:UDP-N-acetylmuramate dehydrogenase